MMRGECVIVSAGKFAHEFFESRCAFKVYQRTAFDANEVMVVCFEGFCELVALFEADLNDIDDTKFCEELECAVNARALGELAGAQDFLEC